MSNHYAIGLLVEQHHADLRNEAAQDRLGRLARRGEPRQRRWWERLMLSRSHTPARPRPTATVAAGDSPC
jgi:hypothetical protein